MTEKAAVVPPGYETTDEAGARRFAMLDKLDDVIRAAMRDAGLDLHFSVMLIGEDAVRQGNWSVSTTTSRETLMLLYQAAIADWTKRVEGNQPGSPEPTPDTITKLRHQFHHTQATPTPHIANEIVRAAHAAGEARAREDWLAESALSLHLAGLALVLHRRAELTFIERHRRRGGAA